MAAAVLGKLLCTCSQCGWSARVRVARNPGKDQGVPVGGVLGSVIIRGMVGVVWVVWRSHIRSYFGGVGGSSSDHSSSQSAGE